MLGTIPGSFISTIPQALWFNALDLLSCLGETGSKTSAWLSPTMMPLTPQAKDNIWKWLQLWSLSIPIIHLRLGKGLLYTWDWVKDWVKDLWIQGTIVGQTLAITPLITWPPYTSVPIAEPWCCFRSSGINVNSDLHLIVLKYVDTPLSLCTVIQLSTSGSLWERVRGISTIYTWYGVSGCFFLRPS